jgi:hypothetical protein
VIILDSNLLHGRANPEAAGPLRTVLALAAQVRIPVGIPEACLIELREGIREKLLETNKKLQDAAAKLTGFHAPTVAPAVDIDAAVARYEALVREFLGRNKIATVGFPERMPDVRSLFELAAKKAAPFDSSGNSYRDAMIALVVEECRLRSGFVFFVTDDSAFHGAFTSEDVFPFTVAETIKLLEERLSKTQQQRREAVRDAIAAALRLQLEDITRRATKEVSFEIDLEPGTSLESIDSLVATGVKSVDPAKLDESAAEFTAKLSGTLTYAVRVDALTRAALTSAMVALLRRPAKVGEAVSRPFGSPATLGEPEVPSYEPGDERETLTSAVTLSVDGSVTLEKDRVTGIEFSALRQEGRARPSR